MVNSESFYRSLMVSDLTSKGDRKRIQKVMRDMKRDLIELIDEKNGTNVTPIKKKDFSIQEAISKIFDTQKDNADIDNILVIVSEGDRVYHKILNSDNGFSLIGKLESVKACMLNDLIEDV